MFVDFTVCKFKFKNQQQLCFSNYELVFFVQVKMRIWHEGKLRGYSRHAYVTSEYWFLQYNETWLIELLLNKQVYPNPNSDKAADCKHVKCSTLTENNV
jgi:hypothetical protein